MDLQDALRYACQVDYKTYVKLVNPEFEMSRFHSYLCDKVQEFVMRQTEKAYEIMIITCPPQHGKSLTITETLPSWYLGKFKKNRVIEISYNEEFAEKFGRANNRKIAEYGRKVFGISLAKQPNTATAFELINHEGGMISRGVTSGVTGNKCNLMIIDDPIKTRQDAESPTMRNRIWSEWNDSYKSRMWVGGKVIVIMTRWHEDDLAGRLMANEANVEYLRFPLEAEEDDLLGRKPGEALCPEIGKDNVWLADFKKGVTGKEGSRTWNALYQCTPVSDKGNIIKREWWRFYSGDVDVIDTVMSVDAAFKDGDSNDYVAIQVWGKNGAKIYLLDAIKKHMDMPSTVREITRLKCMWPGISRILIEDKANGSAIIQVLRTEIPGIVPVNPIGGKVARVNAVSGAIESGNVFVPEDKPFTGDFIDECASFPYGKHDDQVDACSQALARLIFYTSEPVIEKAKDTLTANFPGLAKRMKKATLGRGDKCIPV